MLAGEYSINAKLLYGLLLNRTTLSQKSGWVSEDGNVYAIYTIKQMANDLDRSERMVKTALRELENARLITRVRQGWNQANRIFLQIPDRVQVSSCPEGNTCPMDVQDPSPCKGQKLPTSNTDAKYREQSKTERVESTRCRYGEFQNVFLSSEEYSRLEAAYPGKAAEHIERLSRYMASNDRHYANHYATIKKWLFQKVSTSLPSGLMMPMPVMTTRWVIILSPFPVLRGRIATRCQKSQAQPFSG